MSVGDDIVFPAIALLCLAGFYRFGPNVNRQDLSWFFYVTLISTLFCVLWHWPRLPVFTEQGFYPGDSLYTLGPVKAAALASLTLSLLLCACYGSWSITRAVLRRTRVPTAIAVMAGILNSVVVLILYWLFLSLVPQLYYTIYLQIFPDLPLQWVIRGLMPLQSFLSTLLFAEQASMSVHAAGLLGWVLFINTMIQWLGSQRPLNERFRDL